MVGIEQGQLLVTLLSTEQRWRNWSRGCRNDVMVFEMGQMKHYRDA